MRRLIAVSIAVLASGCCGNSSTTPDVPAESAVTINALAPAAGSTVVVPAVFPYIIPGGVVLPHRSNLVSVDVSLTSAHEVAQRTQLNVYLLTGGTDSEYCGMNDPDSPSWSRLPAGWTTRYEVTGFRVYRLPCDVTGIRVMLHTRNNGLFAPPTPSETIAETIVPLRFRLVREE
jgi:hypothetical protein